MLACATIPRDPLDHFDVLDNDPCSCSICLGWRRAKQVADKAAVKRPPHLPTCNCAACAPTRRARYHLQAMNVRRDLWIEASYHASMHRYGRSYMEWLALDVAAIRDRYAFWANEASRLPLSYWFERFEHAIKTGVVTVTGAVSGVFSFEVYYLDIEQEGGGFASMSSLDVDGISDLEGDAFG